MGNAILAFQAASALLTLITRSAEAVTRINAFISATRVDEDRDLTDDELAAIQAEIASIRAETDEIEARVLGKLRG